MDNRPRSNPPWPEQPIPPPDESVPGQPNNPFTPPEESPPDQPGPTQPTPPYDPSQPVPTTTKFVAALFLRRDTDLFNYVM